MTLHPWVAGDGVNNGYLSFPEGVGQPEDIVDLLLTRLGARAFSLVGKGQD